MRWIKYTAEGRTGYGLVEGDRIVETASDPFTAFAEGILPHWTGRSHALTDVRVEVPFLPRTFYAAGMNYVSHIHEVAAGVGVAPSIPVQPDMGYRAVNALIAHGQPVVIPRDATRVQYEGELAVVIGRLAKHLTEADALGCVLGYTIGNDVSERGWQASDRTFWRSKNTDTFKPMGPWIETAADPAAMVTTVRLNGAIRTSFRTADMLFGIRRFIATLTRYLTLHPGDVIWMGTDGASPDLHPGDVVEVEISGVGTLRNPFVAQSEIQGT